MKYLNGSDYRINHERAGRMTIRVIAQSDFMLQVEVLQAPKIIKSLGPAWRIQKNQILSAEAV